MDTALSSYTDTATSTTAMAAARLAAVGKTDPQRMKNAAQEFESVLIGQLMNLMLESVPTSESFGGGHGEDIYRSMLGEQMGKDMAKRGGLGLSQSILNEMIQMQQQSMIGARQ